MVNLSVLTVAGFSLETHLSIVSTYGALLFIFICLFSTLVPLLVHRNNYGWSSAGASGSITGCLLGYAIIEPQKMLLTVPFLGRVNNVAAVIIYVLLLTVLGFRDSSGRINHEMHLAGAAGGLLATGIICLTGI